MTKTEAPVPDFSESATCSSRGPPKSTRSHWSRTSVAARCPRGARDLWAKRWLSGKPTGHHRPLSLKASTQPKNCLGHKHLEACKHSIKGFRLKAYNLGFDLSSTGTPHRGFPLQAARQLESRWTGVDSEHWFTWGSPTSDSMVSSLKCLLSANRKSTVGLWYLQNSTSLSEKVNTLPRQPVPDLTCSQLQLWIQSPPSIWGAQPVA